MNSLLLRPQDVLHYQGHLLCRNPDDHKNTRELQARIAMNSGGIWLATWHPLEPHNWTLLS